MIFSRFTVFFAITAFSAVYAAETPGMTAYNEQNYDSAVRLLAGEILRLDSSSKEYYERIFAYIDSLLHAGKVELADAELKKLEKAVNAENKTDSDLLRAKLFYVRKDFTAAEKILLELQQNNALTAAMQYDIAVLLAEIYLASARYADAVGLLDETVKNADVVKNGEFLLKSLLLRALAGTGKLNRIPVEFEELKKKYPEMHGRLQHFQLLIYVINQDLKAYRELFTKIFPDEKPLKSFVGDVVLYQGALLGEQQARKEQNYDEIIFHLKNQVYFAPSDEYRAECGRILVELYLEKNKKHDALNEVRRMLKNIPDLKDAGRWALLSAKLQNELNIGDRGLSDYLKLVDNTARDIQIRAEAAKAAAAILKNENKKTEMLKLYAFLSDIPNEPKINDEGLLLTGKYYFENKEFRMGQSVLGKIGAVSASYPEALFYLIQCEIANGETESALRDIKQLAVVPDTGNTELPEFELAAIYFQAVIAENLKKDEEAAALYEKAARHPSRRSGALPILMNSWLKAAELQFKRQSYSNAGLLFLSFAEHYPDAESSAAALYKSVYSYFLAGRFDEMKYSIDKLKKAHPDNKLTVNALFHEMDHIRQSGDLNGALKLLDNIAAINKDATVIPQILYDKALTLYQLRQYPDALKVLEELQKHPESERLADGLFLAGTVSAELGENTRAAQYFEKAAGARNDVLFKSVSMGRAADNYFLAGTKLKNESVLKQSADIYENLTGEKLSLIFRLQCFYKWGRTLEALKNYQGALDAYTEALYLPDAGAVDKGVVPVWINRSAVNAINIHLRQGGANALNDAIFIIRRLKKLNTMTAGELEDLEYSVRNRYGQQQ